ncbi:MAG: 50S ribosomal protein L25/general stress protein Ctc [Burkholderiaceae bacterium]|nr:50S ribosomal protein L25/general stress protein Ctc [Microbacteriaceae bacterium]
MAEKKIDTTIIAEVRESFGKGAARKMRVLGKIPAVVYGHGTQPQHLALPGHQVALLLRKSNAVLELSVDGTTQLALVKDVQKDPVKQIIEHIDLIVIRKGEKVTVSINVHVEGESAPGTIVNLDTNQIEVEAEATHIPERVIVSVEGAEEGTQIFAKDLVLPTGSTLITDPDVLVVNVVIPAEVDLGESDEDETDAEAETPAEETAE